MTPSPSREPSLRALGLSVYLPTFLFAVGQGAVMPIVPLAARELGASVAFAGFVVALRGIGALAFDAPAGWLVARLGESRAMAVGTLMVAVALAGAVWSPTPGMFAAFTLLMGCSWSIWLLARLSYVTDVMPPELRGRALSTLGGVNRIGNFVGPLIGAALAGWTGPYGAYYLHLATAAAAFVLLVSLVRGEDHGRDPAAHATLDLRRIAVDHADVFLTAGVAVAALGALRASRNAVLPLWGEHIGLDAQAVSLLFGITLGIEVLLFYPAGSAMDRFGRRSVALPCLGLLSLGMLLTPLTLQFATLLAVSVLMGIGNGLGSGIVMTLGADFSPAEGRAQFLGAWRLCSDVGQAGGPLLVAATVELMSLGAAALLLGGIGVAGMLLMLMRVPETLPVRSDE